MISFTKLIQELQAQRQQLLETNGTCRYETVTEYRENVARVLQIDEQLKILEGGDDIDE